MSQQQTDRILFTEDEYNKIILSAIKSMTDDEVVRLVSYCELTKIAYIRVSFLIKGLFCVTGIRENGEPIYGDKKHRADSTSMVPN